MHGRFSTNTRPAFIEVGSFRVSVSLTRNGSKLVLASSGKSVRLSAVLIANRFAMPSVHGARSNCVVLLGRVMAFYQINYQVFSELRTSFKKLKYYYYISQIYIYI